jgi:hypothetical protein
MKILLLSENGQVSWELKRSLAPLGERRLLITKVICDDFSQLERLAQTAHTLCVRM